MLGSSTRSAPASAGQLRRETDRLLRRSPGRGRRTASRGRMAALDVYETDDGYAIDVDLPGVGEDALDVELEDHTLLVRARRGPVAEGRNYHHRERPSGTLERAVRLPEEADVDAVDARLRDGVLRIRVPRSTPEGGRRIEISGP